jgi:mannose-6-phosphate isomerase-like protein (cupin superfamily)
VSSPEVFPSTIELNHGWGATLVTRETHPAAELHCGFYWTKPGEETAFSFEDADPEVPGVVHWPKMDDIYIVLEGALEIAWENTEGGGTMRLEPHDIAYLIPGYRYKTRCVSDKPAKIFYCAAPPPARDAIPEMDDIDAAKRTLAADKG